MSKPRVIFLGQVPPPYMGPSLATEIILGSELADTFELIHLDTSHHEELDTLGRLGLANVTAALKHYYMLLKLLVSRKADIVYIPICQTTVGYLRDSVFILLAKLFRKKVVCHLRGGNFRRWYDASSFMTRAYVRSIHAMVDVQIVLGEQLRGLFRGLLPDARIFVVPNGRDFDWAGHQEPGNGNQGKVRVLYLSNFIRSKGVMDVVYAVPRVTEICPQAEFILAGAWFDEDVRLEMQDILGQHPEYPVTIAGKVSGNSKLDLIMSADVFVLPTYYPPEGHPWSIVEALAAGLPIVSTDQGAITESVIDGVNGYIVDKQSPASLAGRIIELCRDPELRSSMGRESRRIYEQEFTEHRMVERMSLALRASIIKTGTLSR